MKMVLVGAARVKVENGKFIIPTRVIMIYIDYRPQRDIPGVPLVGIDSIVLLLNCIAGLCAWVSMQPMTLAVEDMRSGNTKKIDRHLRFFSKEHWSFEFSRYA